MRWVVKSKAVKYNLQNNFRRKKCFDIRLYRGFSPCADHLFFNGKECTVSVPVIPIHECSCFKIPCEYFEEKQNLKYKMDCSCR